MVISPTQMESSSELIELKLFVSTQTENGFELTELKLVVSTQAEKWV